MDTTSSNISFAAQGWTGFRPGDSRSALETAGAAMGDGQAADDARFAAAVLDLVDKLAQANDLEHAGLILVNELQDYFKCDRVAFAISRARSNLCRLAALSNLSQFDPRSDLAQALESAMNECMVRGKATCWPAGDGERHATRAHRTAAIAANAEKIITVPLRNGHELVGVLLFAGAETLDRPPGFEVFVHLCERQLGPWVDLVRRAQPSWAARQLNRLRRSTTRWQRRTSLLLTLLALSLLMMPVPYRVKCDCQVVPVTRRFVVAPFDGRLEESLVKLGDLVTEGQIMARMDGREIRWELAGLVAERNRASKQRDAAMATHKVADAQAAKLEMDRLDLKIQLLQLREQNLEIRSPIQGIVISGDLERAEGAPLTVGQTLFEVAPLNEMVVELAIPEAEISYVKEQAEVRVQLDAYPGRHWSGPLAKVHPRAEILEAQNSFVAELPLNNSDGLLRPGMNGKAKVTAATNPLAWNLFHRPAERLTRILGF